MKTFLVTLRFDQEDKEYIKSYKIMALDYLDAIHSARGMFQNEFQPTEDASVWITVDKVLQLSVVDGSAE